MGKILCRRSSKRKKGSSVKTPETTDTPDFGIPEEWEHLREKALKNRVKVYAGY